MDALSPLTLTLIPLLPFPCRHSTSRLFATSATPGGPKVYAEGQVGNIKRTHLLVLYVCAARATYHIFKDR